MPDTHRSGPKSLVGQEFYDIHELGAYSFCPDSNDASTPATQVHVRIQVKDVLGKILPPFIARFFGKDTLAAFIEALIEHYTYVFGRRKWDASKYEEQK
jgi:hypothetical protein